MLLALGFKNPIEASQGTSPNLAVPPPSGSPPLTPRLPSGERLSLRISEEDHAKVGRGPDWIGQEIEVTDLDSGRRYLIRGAVCSAGAHCACDAEVVSYFDDRR